MAKLASSGSSSSSTRLSDEHVQYACFCLFDSHSLLLNSEERKKWGSLLELVALCAVLCLVKKKKDVLHLSHTHFGDSRTTNPQLARYESILFSTQSVYETKEFDRENVTVWIRRKLNFICVFDGTISYQTTSI